jgi:hypothetical protein
MVFAPTNVIVIPIPMLIDLKELDVITQARSIKKVQRSVFPLFLITLATNGGKAKKISPGHIKSYRNIKSCIHIHSDVTAKTAIITLDKKEMVALGLCLF